MISKQIIEEKVNEFIQDTTLFLVDISVDVANRIVVEIDSFDPVSIEECISLSRFIESSLDREVEDFELEVGSAGISSDFKVLQQYQKNIGKEVELLSKAGQKLTGILTTASDVEFTVTITQKIKQEGAKKKVTVEENLTFTYDQVKYVRNTIKFK